MSDLPLDILTCSDCLSPLAPPERAADGACCPRCKRVFALECEVLDLASRGVAPLTRQTVSQFGASWQIHDHLAEYQERQLLDWIAPLEADDFKGRVVLEAGCGKGRHSKLLAEYGAARLLSVDLSDAILVAAHHTKGLDNVTCIRANLLKLPVADACADVVICLGVLHHLEDPRAGLEELWKKLKPGGTLCLWVYGREGNSWIVHLVDPVRKGVTSRIPTRLLRPLLWPLSGFLFLLLKTLYGPASRWGRRPARRLPYGSYLGYISPFPFREVEHIVLDHLCPPIAYYLSRDQLECWFEPLSPARIAFRWHNRNSWNVVAVKGAAS